MGEIIDHIEELRLRLQAGIDANAIEVSHDEVYVGSREQFLMMNDTPILGIILPSGEGDFTCFNHQQTENLRPQIGYKIPRLHNDYNSLYNTDSTGPMRNFEQIINYVKLNRSTGAVDLQLNGNAYDALKYTWTIQEMTDSNMLFFTMSITSKTAMHTGGAL